MLRILNQIVLVFLFLSSAGSFAHSVEYKGFGEKSLPAKTIEKYRPRAIPTELKNQIEKYMDLHLVKGAFLSPRGDSLYTNWLVTGTPQVWKIETPMTFPVQLTGGEDRTQIDGMSPNGEWIAVRRDRHGDEFFGVYLLSSRGGPLKEIYRKEKVQSYFQTFSDDGKWLYFRANDKEESSYAIYRHNLDTGKTESVFSDPGLWSVGSFNGIDELILVKATGSMQTEHYLYSLDTKKLTPLIGQGLKEDYRVFFSSRKGEYIVLTNQLRDFRSLYLLKAGKLEPLVADLNSDIKDVQLNHDKSLLVYTVNSNGYSQAKALETARWKPVSMPMIEGVEQVNAGAFSQDGKNIVLLTESSRGPGITYSYNFKNKKLTQWDRISTPEIPSQQFVNAKLESYKTEDGTEVPMFVWRTQECEKKLCPVIVIFHGGPEAQFLPNFNPNIHMMLAKGFVVAAPNVRGSDGYGKKWLMSDNGANRLNVVTDIRDAARYIKQNWKVDGKVPKVGIYGGSYGGYSSLAGMTMFAGEYDAGVAVVGISNLLTFLENTAPYRRVTRVNEYGDPVKDKETLKKLSPTTYLAKVKDPVMVLHGLTDPRVPAGEAVQFMEKVKKHAPQSELIIFPDEGHGFSKRPNKVLALGYTLEFFEKNLK